MSPFAFLSEFCFFRDTSPFTACSSFMTSIILFFLSKMVFLLHAYSPIFSSRVPSDPFIAITRSGFSVNSKLWSLLISFLSV